MLKSYLVIALRHLLRHPYQSGINIAGLAVGVMCCLLILLLVEKELSFDRFHENADRIYRIVSPKRDGMVATVPGPLGPAMRDEYPDVIEAVRFSSVRKALISHGDRRFDTDSSSGSNGGAVVIIATA